LKTVKKNNASILVLILVLIAALLVAGCGSEPPMAGIGIGDSPHSGVSPLTVSFYDQSWGKADSWEWDFGDGTTSSEQNPIHTYEIPGAFTVSLTASNGGGSSTRTREDYIRVNPAIDPSVDPVAIMETSMGTIKFGLYERLVPNTVANFTNLTEGGFYDGLTFHRVIDDLVIQTGDPTATGAGGSVQTIDLEVVDELRHVDGAVGMARSGDINSATSQFYICDGAQAQFDGNYAVFGQVIEGMEVVREIASVETDGEKPVEDVIVTKITIQKG